MLTANTFGAMALTALALPLLSDMHEMLGSSTAPPPAAALPDGAERSPAWTWADEPDDGTRAYPVGGGVPKEGRGVMCLSAVTYLSVRALTACAAALCAAVLRKNVVVWALIAPKFVFELFFLAVTAIALLGGVVVSA